MPDSDLLSLLILHVSCGEPRRLDQLVLDGLRARDPKTPVSRGLLKKFFRESPPTLDGKPAASASAELEGRHAVTLTGWAEFLARASVLRPADHCFLPILYEDEDLLILNKAAGVPSVALSGEETHTAVAAALARVPALASIEGAKPLEPGLLHRLDTATSGILAFAKSAAEFSRLRALWKTPAVRKIYRASVEFSAGAPAAGAPATGAPPPAVCTIRDPIAHAADSAGRMVVLAHATAATAEPAEGRGTSRTPAIRGKPLPAVTHIRRVNPVSERVFELEIEIETGVMHQIRAHLASRGWPIVGDRIYNPAFRRERDSASPSGAAQNTRLMLHAWRLELPLKSRGVLEVNALV